MLAVLLLVSKHKHTNAPSSAGLPSCAAAIGTPRFPALLVPPTAPLLPAVFVPPPVAVGLLGEVRVRACCWVLPASRGGGMGGGGLTSAQDTPATS